MSARVISMTECKDVRVLRTIDDIGKENVDSISEDGFFTYGYFKTLETAKPYNIVLFYLAVYDGGNVVAVVPCYVDLDDRFYGLDGKLPFSGSIVGVANRMGFCLNRLVVCYSPNSYHSKIFIRKGYDGKMVLDLLSRRVDDLCRKEKILFSSFVHVPESERLLIEHLEDVGYKKSPSVNIHNLDIQWSSFDDYLESLESSKVRKDIRREIRKCQENGVTIVEETEFGELSLTLSNLHSNLISKYHKGAKSSYDSSFFRNLMKYARDKTRVFIAKRYGKILGFSLSLQHRDILDTYLVGFDYGIRTSTDFAYFNLLFYAPIKLAIEKRYKRIHFSINGEKEKLKRGCKLEKTYTFSNCHNSILRPVYNLYSKRRMSDRVDAA